MGLLATLIQRNPKEKESLNGLGALGMTRTKKIHQEIETELVCTLRPDAMKQKMRVLSECGLDDDLDARIADVLVGTDDDCQFGEPILIIEVCDKNTLSEAKKRINEAFDLPTMKESYIYRFDENQWLVKWKGDQNFSVKNPYSDIFGRDLATIIITADFYKHILNKTYR